MTRLFARFLALGLALASCLATRASAQDTTKGIDNVRVILEYQPGVRPGLVVLPGTSTLDSARAIVRRDLDYSDRFQIVELGDPGSGGTGGGHR